MPLPTRAKAARAWPFPAMTLLEIAQLASQKRIPLTPNLEAFLSEVERRFAILTITGQICVQAFEFP
jgi:hypothetical protein